jgi:hypothetical protein
MESSYAISFTFEKAEMGQLLLRERGKRNCDPVCAWQLLP